MTSDIENSINEAKILVQLMLQNFYVLKIQLMY